ncbi:MAG: EAL domain-containing protein [Acidimicrobiales bacterium]
MVQTMEDPSAIKAGDGRHISGATTATILRWVAEVAGPGSVERLLAVAGDERPASVLEDQTTWSSFEQATALFEAAVEISGMPDAARLIGADMLTQIMGSEVGALLRSLGSPGEVLRNIGASGAKFSTILVLDPLEISGDRALIACHTVPGVPRHKLLCDFTVGILSVVPALFGMDRALVWESECQARGGARCLYHVEWSLTSSPTASPERRIADLESQLSDLDKRFRSLQTMATELVAADDMESVLALLTRRAGVAVRATRYLLAVCLGGRLHIHSDGFTPQEADLVASEILAEDPDDHQGSRLIVDVVSGEHHYGRLAAIYPEGTEFFPQERDLLAAYAGHAAAVLNTASALDEMRCQNRTSTALLSLARSLSEVASSQEVAVKLAAAVTEVVDCASTCVLLWNKGENRLRLVAGVGVSERVESILAETGIGLSDTPEVAKLLSLQEPNFFDYETADEFHRGLMQPDGGSTAVVPIVSRGNFFGIVTASIHRSLASLQGDPDLLARLTGIALQAGTALENAALLDQVRHQALHDSLTGLPNRALLNDRAERALVEAVRVRDRVALVFLDLDRFKKVNDILGHRGGDALLVDVAERLSGALRASDTVVRLGGDEFVVLIPHVRDVAEVEAIAVKITAALASPFMVEGQEVYVTASLGTSMSTSSPGEDFESLLRQADIAMYRAKALGGAVAVTYETGADEPTHDALALEADLHSAIMRQELRVLYQPQVDLVSNELVGVEALVRWQHPRLGMLEPYAFLPIAEESDMIVDIDLWVLGVAARQAASWKQRYGLDLSMAVNLSSRTAHSARLEPAVVSVLADSGIRADCLELEITEKVVDFESQGLRDVVSRLRALGVRMAIDDFGTGSSSFGRVHGIQVDTLKIDRSLLSDLTVNPQTAPLLAAMLNMGSALGMHVVAEGVESSEQANWLRDNSCAVAQGFHFSRPTPPEAIEELVARKKAAADLVAISI